MKFIIDRSKWLRGEGGVNSRLFRESDGKMCCVGQMCMQLGQPVNTLIGKKVAVAIIPADRSEAFKTFMPGLDYEASWLEDAYKLNDVFGFDDDEREEQLTALLDAHGHEIEFIDGGAV